MRIFNQLLLSTACLTLFSIPANAATFTSFGGFDTDGPAFAGMGRYAESAPPWFAGATATPLPGWDDNVQWDWSATFTDAFAPVGDDPLVIAAPFSSTSTVVDLNESGDVIGTMSWQGTGMFDTDLNVASAIVDDVSGQIFTPYHLIETYEITEQTGTLATLTMDSPWVTEVRGRSSRLLITGQDLAEATSNPIVSSSSTFVISGEYSIVPEPGCGLLLVYFGLLLPCFHSRIGRVRRSPLQP